MDGGWAQTMVLGALLSLVLGMVYPAIRRVCSFPSNLNGLHSILSTVNDAVGDIETLSINRPLHVTEQFVAQVAEADKLWRRCSALSKWNIFRRWYYSNVLSSFETTLREKFQSLGVVLHLHEDAVRRELQETSPHIGVGAEVEGNRSAEMDDDEKQHHHASEIQIVIM